MVISIAAITGKFVFAGRPVYVDSTGLSSIVFYPSQVM